MGLLRGTLDAITLGESRAPVEVRLFAAGWTSTTKGKFLFDEKSAESVIKDFSEHGNRLVFDYDHAMVSEVARPQDKTAAANFALEVREGPELWAVDIKWTPAALAAIEAGEWLYFSPTFYFDKKTKRIEKILNVALTNLPATYGMTPLVADGVDESGAEPEKGAHMGALFHEDAHEDEAVRLIQEKDSIIARILELSNTENIDGALGVLRAGLAAIEQVQVLSAEVAGLRAAQESAEKTALIQANNRKFNDALRQWAEKQSLAALAEFVRVAPDLVPVAAKLTQPAVQSTATLTDEEKHFAKLFGHDVAELAKYKSEVGQ